jgi:mannan endo-1,4-beta-mannosidase
MGGKVVRGHTLGVSTGNPLSFEPKLGVFNSSALHFADFAIDTAGKLGIKLVIPLTDNYHYYHGGKHDFTDWRGISDENQFFTNSQVISDFKEYINQLFNHINAFNGIANKDNPTILAWETANEIHPPVSWTQIIADYIKSIDPNHLVLDGTYGVNSEALPISSVDIYSRHYYPPNNNQVSQDASACAGASKVYYVGEYDWTNNNVLPQFLSTIEQHSVGGDTYWSLFPHLDNYGWEQHSDSFTLHFPTGSSSSQEQNILTLRAHAFKMSGNSVANYSVPLAPQITLLETGTIGWRGVVGAQTYSIDRSMNNNGPWVNICNKCVNDNNAPWKNSQVTSNNWYRVSAWNEAGSQGPFSPARSLN